MEFFGAAYNATSSDGGPNGNTEVLVQPEFLAGVGALVKKYQATPKGLTILNNYLTWRLIDKYFPDRPAGRQIHFC